VNAEWKSSPIFRQPAIDSASRRLEGGLVVSSSKGVRLAGFACAGLLLGLIMVVGSGSYARKATAEGWLVPEGGLIRVLARQDGVVSHIDVQEGARVRAGANLAAMRLTGVADSARGADDLQAALISETLAGDAATAAAEAKIRVDQGAQRARAAALRGELAETDEQLRLVSAKSALIDSELARSTLLNQRGYFSTASLDEIKARALAVAQEGSGLRAARSALARQLRDIDYAVEGGEEEAASLAAQRRRDQAIAAQRVARSTLDFNANAVAPVDGTIALIGVSPGEHVGKDATVALMTPVGAPLIAELYVPSSASGFLALGQEVRLMFPAFPLERFAASSSAVS